MRQIILNTLLSTSMVVLGLFVNSQAFAKTDNNTAMIKTASGLQYQDTVPGTGIQATKGKQVTVHYTGWLSQDGNKGKQFGSSHDKGNPLPFVLGEGKVIKGWDEGIEGMKVGGKRTLIVPPSLGYGDKAFGDSIPANSTFIFEVELLSVS